MKNILITTRLDKAIHYYEIRNALDANWGYLFSQIDFLPLILPLNISFRRYFENFDIAGVIFSGGNDLSVLNDNSLSIKRDEYEKQLLEFCINNHISVLGICRGMQFIANYFGCEFDNLTNHVATRHRIEVMANLQYSLSLKRIGEVNSFHNWGIKKISDNFHILAMAEDNTIEAFVHQKLPLFGQMWHSERENPFNKYELEFIKQIFEK